MNCNSFRSERSRMLYRGSSSKSHPIQGRPRSRVIFCNRDLDCILEIALGSKPARKGDDDLVDRASASYFVGSWFETAKAGAANH